MSWSRFHNRNRLLRRYWCRGVTLVELMVTMTVLVLIMAMLLALTNQTSRLWKGTAARIEAFQNARAAFHSMTQRLSQATLNTYLDYYDASDKPRDPAVTTPVFVPSYYARNAELHFCSGQASTLIPNNGLTHTGHAVFFVAPLGITSTSTDYGGLPRALNACGYYTEFNSDATGIPPFLASQSVIQPKWRFRLMEFLQPTEQLGIYNLPSTGAATQYRRWFTDFLPPAAGAPVRMVAENIVALIIAPQLPPDSIDPAIAQDYTYDTRDGLPRDVNHHQLPPLVRVVMIAIDEPSAIRLAQSSGSTPPAAVVNALAGRFASAASLETDLAAVTQALSDARVAYRVFDNTIALRGAKWSR